MLPITGLLPASPPPPEELPLSKAAILTSYLSNTESIYGLE